MLLNVKHKGNIEVPLTDALRQGSKAFAGSSVTCGEEEENERSTYYNGLSYRKQDFLATFYCFNSHMTCTLHLFWMAASHADEYDSTVRTAIDSPHSLNLKWIRRWDFLLEQKAAHADQHFEPRTLPTQSLDIFDQVQAFQQRKKWKWWLPVDRTIPIWVFLIHRPCHHYTM